MSSIPVAQCALAMAEMPADSKTNLANNPDVVEQTCREIE